MVSIQSILCLSIITFLFIINITTTYALPRSNDLPILTDRPVIGILAQPISSPPTAAYPNRQYIAASYVKYIESAGGRVIPINWYATREEIQTLLPKLNGVLLTGGDSEYHTIINHIYDIAILLNNNGIHFPVWSTCQGFQFTSIYFAKNEKLLKNIEVYNQALALNITNEAMNSNWFSQMPINLQHIIADPTTPTTMNFHHFGVSVDDFKSQLSNQFWLIATNIDNKGINHVSAMEHRSYPFTAVQYHPEKNNYEFAVNPDGTSKFNIPHTFTAIAISQYTSNWFVHECRKNKNEFTNWKELQALLIYNYSPQRVEPAGFVENYVFDQWF